MAILKSCCCGKSVRRGSFGSAIFCLVVYTILMTATAFHITTASTSPVLLFFTVSFAIFSAGCVLSSVVLIVGLCMDNRLMLWPWIVSASITTFLNLIVAIFYMFTDEEHEEMLNEGIDFRPKIEKNFTDVETLSESEATGLDFLTITAFMLDFIICGITVYCILCVVSQYQEYLAGRGRAGQNPNDPPLPVLRLQQSQSSVKPMTSSLLANKPSENGSTSPSTHLLPPKPHVYVPALRGPLELSSISEEPSSHDPGAKISTDDTSLDDDSHTSSTFGPKKLFTLPEKRVRSVARPQGHKRNTDESRSKQETKVALPSGKEEAGPISNLEKTHLLEGFSEASRKTDHLQFRDIPSVLTSEDSKDDEDTSVGDSQQWI